MNGESEAEKILQEIITLTGHKLRQFGDMDLGDYVKATGLSLAGARGRLRKAVEDGTLETFKVYDPQRKQTIRVWRPVKGITGQKDPV